MPAKQRNHSPSRSKAKKTGYNLASTSEVQIPKIDANPLSQRGPMRKDMNRDALPESSL